ncbi:MAG: hypothetical protein K0U12_02320, partial [Gammaproteobacteria bacterium]|nr:hypothetical protein [Gammaproteobacteria bacterium]
GFTVDEIQGSKIIGRKVEYKYYFAQQEIPELVEALDIALLGVSGILRCPQGWVFGRRAQTVTEYPGVWELVPSGNIDASYIMTDSTTAVRQQLFTELKEEVGLAAEDIVATRLQVMVVDAKAHAIDIGVMLDTNLAFENILQAQQRLGSLEYDALQVISFEGLNDFFEDYPVLEASKCFLNSIDHAAGS